VLVPRVRRQLVRLHPAHLGEPERCGARMSRRDQAYHHPPTRSMRKRPAMTPVTGVTRAFSPCKCVRSRIPAVSRLPGSFARAGKPVYACRACRGPHQCNPAPNRRIVWPIPPAPCSSAPARAPPPRPGHPDHHLCWSTTFTRKQVGDRHPEQELTSAVCKRQWRRNSSVVAQTHAATRPMRCQKRRG